MTDGPANTKTEEVPTPKQGEADWWDNWFDDDFSWQGLANKPILEDRQVTLQNYWRRDGVTLVERSDQELLDLGLLVREPSESGAGRLWHIAHVPLAWKDGLPAKSEWNSTLRQTLRAEIDLRLQHAEASPLDDITFPHETDFDVMLEDIARTKGHVPLVGVVLVDPLAHPKGAENPLYITSFSAYIGAGFGDNAVFSRNAVFYGCLFHGFRPDLTPEGGVLRLTNCSIVSLHSVENAFLDSEKPRQSVRGALLCNDVKIYCQYRNIDMDFADSVIFYGCTFYRFCSFAGASFQSELNLEGCAFFASLSISKARCDGNLNLQAAVIEGRLRADRAKLSGAADFSSLKVVGGINFREAQFEDTASFEYLDCEAEAVFVKARLAKYVTFEQAQIKGVFEAWGTRFEGPASFNEVRFSKEAYFREAEFHGDTDFVNANFAASLVMPRVIATGLVNFSQSLCAATAEFSNSRLLGGVRFDQTTFEKSVTFQHVAFEYEGKSGRLSFKNCAFLSQASFKSARFSNAIGDMSGAFYGARFADVADFTDTGVWWIAAFHEALIERKVLLDKPSERKADEVFQKVMLPGCLAAAKTELALWVEGENKRRKRQNGKQKSVGMLERSRMSDRLHDERLRELEGGCQTIKLVMGSTRDEILEQRYYRYQLRARTSRKISVWEYLFSNAYGLFSNYGASIVRPFVALAGLLLSFAAGFWAIGLALGIVKLHDTSDIIEALELSWLNVFKPLSALSSDNVAAHSLTDNLLHSNPYRLVAFGVTCASTVESLLALTLAFLLVLAVRRRFQIGS